MWVNAISTRGDDIRFKLNLGVALSIEEYPDRYEVNYPGEDGLYRVKKTPEMVAAYNSLVPEKSQPVVPAEPTYEGPFRITGLGLYETVDGEPVRISDFDEDDPHIPWCSDKGLWYQPDGTLYAMPRSDGRHIVKLIKLDEVQPAELAWVVQDKVPARVGIDQFRYVFGDGTPENDWAPVQEEDNWDETSVYGYVAPDGTVLELRCLKEVQP